MIKKHNQIFKNKKLKNTFFYNDIDKGIKAADCVMTDVWISMGEKNYNNKKKLLSRFQVNNKIMKKAKKNAVFMHCLPAHRNEEVTSDVLDGAQSIVWKQVENRMYVQQSILDYLINNDKK